MVRDSNVPQLAFYSVADHRHFLGLVALINSIRLREPTAPVVVVDAGLAEDQAELVSSQATLVAPPLDLPLVALRPVGPLAHPASVAVLLDADVILTRELSDLIAIAGTGRLVAFQDNEPHQSRFFPEWQDVLELPALRRQPYCNAGQAIVPEARSEVLRMWQRCLTKIDSTRTWYASRDLSYPFYFGDQDVFNALAASHLRADEITILDHRLAPHPPFRGLELVDAARLRCAYDDGLQPYFLHHTLDKPWLRATRASVYSRLLSRLLLSPDVAIRLRPDDVPLRLRSGRLARADSVRATVQARSVSTLRRHVARFGVRTRVAAWRRRRTRAA